MAGNASRIEKIGGVSAFWTNIITNVKTARFRAVFFIYKKNRGAVYKIYRNIPQGVKLFQG